MTLEQGFELAKQTIYDNNILTWKKGTFDNAKRFYPYEEEKCVFCSSIRSPSRSYPYSLYTHCKSMKHSIAKILENNKISITEENIKLIKKLIKPAKLALDFEK
jgi:hypothetical protein